ncbi:chromate transporter [Bdellovibrio sp. qaytius]|nr:chromate transporter [Bdellovibrio sp. qaytius]
MNNLNNQVSLQEIALSFLKLGTTAFGGPAAHIAMMERDLVDKKQWLTKEEFLDLLAATNLIPGPNSTELAIHIGHKKAGWTGLIVAGICFILPAFLIVWAIAWFYIKFGSLPAFKAIFTATIPVIIAVIFQAVYSLSKSAVKNITHYTLAALSLAAYLFGVNELLILFAAALLNLLWREKRSFTGLSAFAAVANPTVNQLGLYFAKVGSVLFGSGYVLVAFLQNDLVHKYQWITQQQLIDAIAVGQFTPGPVFTTATFIGYLIAGNIGAITATVGIFLPAFIFVALSAPFIPRLRKSKRISYILDGLNVSSLSLMLGASFLLFSSSEFSYYFIIALIVSLFLLIRYKLNSAWLILAAALIGFLNF